MDLAAFENAIPQCKQCERLVSYRETVAREKRRAYASETYWGRPLPGWGDPHARILLVGLAPGAHGANRTGRMFTGDRSGDFLFPALHRAGFASQPYSVSVSDGTTLHDVFITNVVRCVPPQNKPAADEIDRCRHYLQKEFGFLPHMRCIIALGKLAFDECIVLLSRLGILLPSPRPRFSHACIYSLGKYDLIGSYHPSQRNTSTNLLTSEMLDEVFALAHRSLGRDHQETDEINQHAGHAAGHERQ